MTAPRARLQQSTQLRNPSMDLQSDVKQKVYTAALERQVLILAKRDIQMRSVCEAATGMPYDTFDPRNMTVEDIAEVVAQDMARGLNLSIQDARSLVRENIQTANPSQKETGVVAGPTQG